MYVGGRKETWLLDRVNKTRLEDVCVLTPGDWLDLLDKLNSQTSARHWGLFERQALYMDSLTAELLLDPGKIHLGGTLYSKSTIMEWVG